jgi:hypothetical protein
MAAKIEMDGKTIIWIVGLCVGFTAVLVLGLASILRERDFRAEAKADQLKIESVSPPSSTTPPPAREP